MGATHPIVGETHLSHFAPLNQLVPALLEELLANSKIERLPPGRRLFNRNDTGSSTHFLLSGQLALVSEDHKTKMLRADSRESRAPIDPHDPHRLTALARTSVTILSIDAGLLADLLQRSGALPLPSNARNDDPEHDIAIDEQLFATPLFSDLPRPHLQVLKNRMTQVRVTAGEFLLRAGDPAQFYYLVRSGRFGLSIRSRQRGQKSMLTELGPGDGIGEASLISNSRYEVTATALEDSHVIRFSKGEFLTLLVRPHIKWISYSDMLRMQPAGAILLDVRSSRTFNRNHLPGSINLPLKMLHQTARLFDRNHDYIVYSDRPRQATTAAFLLARHGIETRLLSSARLPENPSKAGSGVRGFSLLHT